jgi:SPP1 family predicted phage head-tail adaptor
MKNIAYQFDRKITFQKTVDTLNEVNETIQEPQDYITTYARIEPFKPFTTKGGEYLEDGKAKPEILYKVTINYLSTSAITSDMLIKYGDRTFQIIGIMNLLEENRIIELTCTEKVIP